MRSKSRAVLLRLVFTLVALVAAGFVSNRVLKNAGQVGCKVIFLTHIVLDARKRFDERAGFQLPVS